MKFSSPSSSTSFSANFCTSKGNALGCLTGFLSRILCSKTPPTYPSSEFENRQQLFDSEKPGDGSGTPNLVARLMGLEFMPEFSSNDDQKGWNSVIRSKSMDDSGDFRAETEEMQGKQGQHRRVKTSFSFRETEDFFELEDDNFLVLNFEVKSVRKKKKGKNFGKSEVVGKCRRKQRRNRDEQGKKNRVFSDEERVNLRIFDSDSDVSKQSYKLSSLKDNMSGLKEVEDGIIKVKKKKKKENCLELRGKKGEEVECELDNYSPVSVLDDSEFISDPEVTVSNNSAEEDAKSRWSECESKELSSSEEIDTKTEQNEEKKSGLKRKDYKKHENSEMLRRICRLAEEDFSNDSNWKYRRMFRAEEIDYISLHFSHLIFDHLITELVDQLI